MLIYELSNKYTDIVPEAAPRNILDNKYAIYMDRNGKDTDNTRHIYRGVKFLGNGENYKMHKIEWCEVGLQFLPTADLLHTIRDSL